MIGVFDTTDLVGPGAEAADILLVAGYCLPRERFPDLLLRVRDVKRRLCGNPDIPVKWNLRGQPRALALHGCTQLQDRLLQVANELRTEMLRCLREAGPTVFLSVLHAYSYRRNVLVDLREPLTRFAFGNLLMRIGLLRHGATDTRQTELLLDWPEGNAPAPFVGEYLSAWRDGVSPNAVQAVKYRCGPLRDLGFLQGPTFGVTDVDERLQLADLCVAVGRQFVNYATGRGREDELGTTEFRRLIPHLYRQGGMVMGRGVTVGPINGVLSGHVLNALRRLGA